MRVLITGASNGMGASFAKKLSEQGYDLTLVARSREKLIQLEQELKTDVELIVMDLSIEENVYKLYDMTKGRIDFLINNAGFGTFGKFIETDLHNELNMVDLNVKTYHILTKLFLKEFVSKNEGRILNVASSASFQPGPLMATYYATKAYVYNLSSAIYQELKKDKSNVHISILCPGPVNTGFNDRAKVKFGVKALESNDVVEYALKQTFKNKLTIIPGFTMKLGVFANRLLPRKTILKITYKIQKAKTLQ